MKNLKNRVHLIGHLGVDPEMKTFEGGTQRVRFTIATNDSYTNKKGEKVEETQWHNVIAFGKTAEVINKYCKKGKEIIVEGKLTSRDYTDDKGIKRYITEIIANEIMFIGGKKNEA
jgi:single-strand DNA-binding protein